MSEVVVDETVTEEPATDTATEVEGAVEAPSKPKKEKTVKPKKTERKEKKAEKKSARKEKKAPKAAKPKVERKKRDESYYVSKHTDGKINADQIRILRALRSAGKRELNREDLKEAVGIGRDGKYSSKWLEGLWKLAKSKPAMIRVIEHEPQEGEGRAKMTHLITADGKSVLEKAEKAYAAHCKEEAKAAKA